MKQDIIQVERDVLRVLQRIVFLAMHQQELVLHVVKDIISQEHRVQHAVQKLQIVSIVQQQRVRAQNVLQINIS